MDPYQYQPLPIRPEPGSIDYNPQGPRWFRLLTLAPGTGDEDLELKIEIYNLTDAPPYEALSYCWGPEEGELYVILVGWAKSGLIKVRPNLRQALLHLRLPTQHRRLWIDAICINQGDNTEKADQIMFMRDIYQNANRTIIWLGTGNASIEGAFKLSGQIRQQMQYLKGFPTSYEEYYTLCEFRDRDFLQRGEVAMSEWNALREIFLREWFTRVWVIQEVIASSWSVCRCGNAETSFLDLLSAIQIVLDYADASDPSMSRVVHGTITFWTNVYHRKRELLAAGDARPYRTPLSKILINSGGNFSSTDPRDIIYGVLGITTDTIGGVTAVIDTTQTQASPPKSLRRKIIKAGLTKFIEGSISALEAINPSQDPWRHPFLRPDYNKPVQEVYRDVTRYLLHRSPRVLDILAVVDHDGDPYIDGFPSWVPRYDKKKLTRMRLGSGMWLTTKRWSEIDDNRMRPSRPNVLALKGVNLGQVEQISRVMDFSAGPLPTIDDVWSDISSCDVFSPDPPRYFNGESLGIALGLTVTAGELGSFNGTARVNVDRNAAEMSHSNEGIVLRTQIMMKSITAFHSIMFHQRSDLPLPDAEETKQVAFPFMTTSTAFATGRRLFWTKDRRLGMGPSIMQPSDLIYGLNGGRTPFILRPCSNYYTFIGECYVYDQDLLWGVRAQQLSANTHTVEIR